MTKARSSPQANKPLSEPENPYHQLVTVQITMEKALRDALKVKAQFLGFDSIQAYVRFWALAEAEGRKINLDVQGWEPQPIFLIEP